jgi:hypothetical protein
VAPTGYPCRGQRRLAGQWGRRPLPARRMSLSHQSRLTAVPRRSPDLQPAGVGRRRVSQTGWPSSSSGRSNPFVAAVGLGRSGVTPAESGSGRQWQAAAGSGRQRRRVVRPVVARNPSVPQLYVWVVLTSRHGGASQRGIQGQSSVRRGLVVPLPAEAALGPALTCRDRR